MKPGSDHIESRAIFITLSPGAFIRASTKLSTVLLDCDLLYMDVHDFWFSGKVVRSSSGFVQCYRTVVAFCFKDYDCTCTRYQSVTYM